MCEITFENGVKAPADCACYKAVMQAYRLLDDVPAHVAMDAAVRVYRYHHPEDSMHNASLTVERWVNETRIH
ncbi:MAG: hypothetical protein LRZ85_06305 [Alphaproteobacteria bacterium]|nr:hypothetical protein [Alphaproteobacteria bacterium]MCD8526423.1 hypothetical protein [Alphaproteobacteria bacterium]MCD8571569.1 hypothetical protein [Alphaproteobacteria bacterium]